MRNTLTGYLNLRFPFYLVSMQQLIKQAIASDSLLGNACKQYLNKKAHGIVKAL